MHTNRPGVAPHAGLFPYVAVGIRFEASLTSLCTLILAMSGSLVGSMLDQLPYFSLVSSNPLAFFFPDKHSLVNRDMRPIRARQCIRNMSSRQGSRNMSSMRKSTRNNLLFCRPCVVAIGVPCGHCRRLRHCRQRVGWSP